MFSPSEIDSFQRKLAEIDRARAQNEARLATCPPHSRDHNNYIRQELESGASELLAERERTQRKIKDAKAAHERAFRFPALRRQALDPEQQRQKAALDF